MAKDLPFDWHAGDPVPRSEIYTDPPESPDPTRIQFYGALDSDHEHRLYVLPAIVSITEIIEAFEVGSHNAFMHGSDPETMKKLVAEQAEQIALILPCRVVFADAAGLRLRFTRQISENELLEIEKLFSGVDEFQAGLEIYLSEWSGQGKILDPVLKENCFRFWWD